MSRHLIAYQYDTDKSQLYLDNYERHFGSLVGQDTNLLELGINRGGSLFMWRDYFRKGKIVGLDINQISLDDPTGRIHVYQGDQRDLGLLDCIGVECAPEGFDIIIDDASHIAEFTEVSFWHLFEHHLKPGGTYVIEDWRVGYWEAWDDGASYRPPSATRVWPSRLSWKHRHRSAFPSHIYGLVGFTKQLMDELGMDAITNPARGGLPPQRLPRFQRMEICPGQVFIVKATKQDNHRVSEQWRGPVGHS